jgi:hypothetical protein
MRSVFDDGAMVNAIDYDMFSAIAKRLTVPTQSSRILRMADGRLVPSKGIWTGTVEVAGVPATGTFEIFNSGGAWTVLFGKPLLEAFKATHAYETDTIALPTKGATVTLANQFLRATNGMAKLMAGLTLDIKQRTNFKGDRASPSRQVSHYIGMTSKENNNNPRSHSDQFTFNTHSQSSKPRHTKSEPSLTTTVTSAPPPLTAAGTTRISKADRIAWRALLKTRHTDDLSHTQRERTLNAPIWNIAEPRSHTTPFPNDIPEIFPELPKAFDKSILTRKLNLLSPNE